MLIQEPVTTSVWKLLEELFLESANKQSTGKYAALSDADKRSALLEFANEQALISKRWAAIVQDLRSVGLRSWTRTIEIAGVVTGATAKPGIAIAGVRTWQPPIPLTVLKAPAMTYFTDASTTGQVFFGQLPWVIGIIEEPNTRLLIGTAMRRGRTDEGQAVWSLRDANLMNL
jgi:hypothetical protein